MHVTDVNSKHIFRAIMGLYLAMIAFWFSGAIYRKYTIPALYSLIIFMWGLAAGRILSFFLDGTAHWLLNLYGVLEIVLGCVGAVLLKSLIAKEPSPRD